jgi:hypothetical protein
MKTVGDAHSHSQNRGEWNWTVRAYCSLFHNVFHPNVFIGRSEHAKGLSSGYFFVSLHVQGVERAKAID